MYINVNKQGQPVYKKKRQKDGFTMTQRFIQLHRYTDIETKKHTNSVIKKEKNRKKTTYKKNV